MAGRAHLDTEAVIAYLEASNVDEAAKRHLERCHECGERLAEMQRILGAFDLVRQEGGREALFQRAFARIREGDGLSEDLQRAISEARRWAAESETTSGRSKRSLAEAALEAAGKVADAASEAASTFVASLVGDSWADAVVGVRGSDTVSPRLLLFQAGDFTVTLTMHPSGDPESGLFDIEGQVAPNEGQDLPPARTVELLSSEGRQISELSELGSFSFDGVSISGAQLRVSMGRATYQIGPLPTGSGSEE